MTDVFLFSCLAVSVVSTGFALWTGHSIRRLRKKYSKVIDADAAIATRQAQFEEDHRKRTLEAQQAFEAKQRELANAEAQLSTRLAEIERDRVKALSTLDALRLQVTNESAKLKLLTAEIESVEEHLNDLSFGLYKPHFSFDTSVEYRSALEACRSSQSAAIREARAAVFKNEWTVNGSKSEGRKMQRQYQKLLLRAFNTECDNAIANVSWNNVEKMEERLRRAARSLNDLGQVMQISITQEYVDLRLKELYLVFEHQQKRNEEREKEKEIRERIREEEKTAKEIQKAQEEAERDEASFLKAILAAQKEAQTATGAQLQRLTDQIAAFEQKLEAARTAKAKAIARAQFTKSGFVYVISNVGSFGEEVVKIGMTRRLEPMERIRELGDASVPFPFDLHVMLYSDNAPELESALHGQFADRRVNLVNPRREFYRGVSLAEIRSFVERRGLSAQFSDIAEAREFRESLVRRKLVQNSVASQAGESDLHGRV